MGDKVLPLDVPVMSGTEVTDLVGLLAPDVPEEHTEARNALIEGIIEESDDEGLMDRYLGGETVTEAALLEDLHRAMARGTFFPVVPVCSTSGVGCGELLDLIVRGFPAPSEHPPPEAYTPEGKPTDPVTCDPAGPLLAEVVKTASDAYVGRVSLVRVFSGSLDPDLPVHVSGHLTSFFGDGVGHGDHDDDERIGSLAYPFGQHLTPAKRAVAGDIASVGRLTRAETGDTLSSVDDPRVLRPWTLPTPLLPVGIEAATRSDEDKLSTALGRLTAEDPSLRVEIGGEQVVLWTMGEAHADAALERLADRFGVTVTKVDVRVPMRETLAGSGKALGRHVKQSGGHGQYAVCEIEVEPLPRGAGFEFAEQGGRRRGAQAVHPLGREGRAGAAGEGLWRPPDGRRQGDPDRRQGAQRRLLGHGVPERRRARPARGGGGGRRPGARAGRRDRGDACPTSSWAR